MKLDMLKTDLLIVFLFINGKMKKKKFYCKLKILKIDINNIINNI